MKTGLNIVCVGLIIILSCACSDSRPKEKANVIIITLDTHRADHTSFQNPEIVSTPNIDFLANKGISFSNCYSLIPITLPAHASIFYSQPPWKLRVYNNGEVFLGENKESLSEIFKKNGYSTGAFVSLGVLLKKFGLDAGFDSYKDDFIETRWYLTAGEVNNQVFSWLDQIPQHPFFLWIHYSDPHDPYDPPASPIDMKIYFNRDFHQEFCLRKYQKEEIKIVLRKGKNVLRFQVFNEFDREPYNFKARLDMLEFIPPPNEKRPKVIFKQGWRIREKEKTIYGLKRNAYLTIHSDKDQLPLTIKFRGSCT